MSRANESAYPKRITKSVFDGKSYEMCEGGLTKLELFSAMAMQGMITRNAKHPAACAAYAVGYAHALLAELEKEQTA